jgi:hypothetical protein
MPTWSRFSSKFNVFEFSLQKEGCVNVPHLVPIAFCCPLLTEPKQCNKVENSAIKCYFIAPFLAINGSVMRIRKC